MIKVRDRQKHSILIHRIAKITKGDAQQRVSFQNSFAYSANEYEVVIGFVTGGTYYDWTPKVSIRTTSEPGNHGFPVVTEGDSFWESLQIFTERHGEAPELLVTACGSNKEKETIVGYIIQ